MRKLFSSVKRFIRQQRCSFNDLETCKKRIIQFDDLTNFVFSTFSLRIVPSY